MDDKKKYYITEYLMEKKEKRIMNGDKKTNDDEIHTRKMPGIFFI